MSWQWWPVALQTGHLGLAKLAGSAALTPSSVCCVQQVEATRVKCCSVVVKAAFAAQCSTSGEVA